MTGQRVGGLFLIAGSTGFGLKVLSSITGGSIAGGTELLSVPIVIYVASMILLGLGAVIVAIGPPPRRAAGLVRAGLALVAVGLLGMAYLEASPLQGDPLSSPILLLLYLAYPLGQIVVGIALLVESGASRVVGALFVGGLAAIVATGLVGQIAARTGAEIAALAGAMGIAGGWAGLGLLVFARAPGRPSGSLLSG